MKTLNTSEISTVSIKVTEEIESRSLHNFLRTSITNSNLFFSKYTQYYFYYNSNTLTYEIIFYEKSSEGITLEPFLIVQKLNQNDDMVKVFLANDYFIVSKNNKLLIFKKVNSRNKEEISLFVKQMYKIKEFETIEITQDYLDSLVHEKYLPFIDEFYPLYPKKSFYIFCTFITVVSLIFIFMVYFNYYQENSVKNTKPIQQIVHSIQDDKTMNKTIELFKYIKSNHIVIDKVTYSNSKIKTILYHKDKSHLLAFTNGYKENLHIKLLKFNDVKSLYSMEITVEY